MEDSGLDSNNGTFINRGTVYAVGTSMDMAEEESKQSTMNLIWEDGVDANSSISIQDLNGTEIIKYNTAEEDFIKIRINFIYFIEITS